MDDGSTFASGIAVLPDWVRRRPITVSDYYQMAEAGILGADERIELIEGQIIPMAPIGSEHAGRVIGLNQMLVMAVAGRALVSTQNPLRLSGISEPEPDFAVLKLRHGNYTDRHPTAEDVLLLIEVADTSLVYDMTVKAGLYARHRVPELWIVDVRRRTVTIHRDPADGSYANIQVSTEENRLTIAALPGITFRAGDISQ